MERPDGAGRERRLDEEPAVGPNHAGVGKRGPRDPLATEPVVGERALDPEEVVGRVGEGGGDEEPRLAAADLDLEGSGAAEPRARVERPADPELLVRPAREASR